MAPLLWSVPQHMHYETSEITGKEIESCTSPLSLFFKGFLYLTERDTAREGIQAGGVGEGEAGFLPSEQRARYGARSQDPKTMT